MSLEGTVDYALARVQSQYGARLHAEDWRRLEASHDLGQYLEGARGGRLLDLGLPASTAIATRIRLSARCAPPGVNTSGPSPAGTRVAGRRG